MAQSTTSRRFYIDQDMDHTIVHRVPVQRATWTPPASEATAASHQVPTDRQAAHPGHLRATQHRVGQLLRTARKRHHSNAS